jgi:hypothetical protein
MREPRLNTQATNVVRDNAPQSSTAQQSRANGAREKLEGETQDEYVERLTAEYKAKMSDETPPALFNRAVTFIQAMASKMFELPASEALQAERLEVCFDCEHFVVAFDAPEQVGHCAACGCAKKGKMTSLPEKAKILKSTCPKQKWDVTIDPAAVALPIAPPPQ